MTTRPELESSSPRTIVIELEHDLTVRFRGEAAKRERTVQQLIRELLDVIAVDQLTTAILDDVQNQGEADRPQRRRRSRTRTAEGP